MGKKSRDKGKRVERLAVKWWRARGYSAKRTAQHMGSPESADIVVAATPFHIEVKGGKRTPNPYEAIAQAKRDCGVSTPLVMVKKDNAPWLFVIHEDDFMEIWDNERA